MKKLFHISALALLSIAMFTSCEGFLDAENKSSSQTADEFFSTADGLASLRVRAYYDFRSLVTQIDIYEDGTDLYIPTRGKSPSQFHTFTVTPENGTVSSFYTSCYTLINRANAIIHYGGESSAYAAEAKFIRAYGYYLLSQHFGSVPITEGYVNDANRSYPRKPLQEVYNEIINDLLAIVDDATLPLESPADGAISQRAAKALLAKVYLAAGWDLETTVTDEAKGLYTIDGTDYFKKAAAMAERAIAEGAVKDLTTMSFEDKWSPSKEGNGETIFAIQYDRAGDPGEANAGGHGLQNDFGGYYGQPTSTGMKNVGSVRAPSKKAIYLFGPGDERYDATFMTTIYNYDGTWGTTGYWGYYLGDKSTLSIANQYMPYYTTPATYEAYLAANKATFAKGSNINEAIAYILSDPMVKYVFKADGSYTKTTGLLYSSTGELANVNSTMCVKKWDDPTSVQEDGNTSQCYRDVVVLHLSDIYLVAAEAYLMAGEDDKSLAKINAVRNRSNAGALASFAAYDPDYSGTSLGALTPLDLVLDERARELFAENQRWMDLRRTRQLLRYNVAFNEQIGGNYALLCNSLGEAKWYRPIPQNEISSNTAISSADQNKGY